MDWGCGTVRDCLLGKCEALASVPSIVGRRGTKQRGRMESILQVKAQGERKSSKQEGLHLDGLGGKIQLRSPAEVLQVGVHMESGGLWCQAHCL